MGFLDKVKHGLEQGVTTVTSKSKELVDSTKVKMDIDSLQKKKKGMFEEIGSMVYSMLSGGGLDEAGLREKCDAVTGIDNEIKAKEDELKQIQK